MALLDNLPNIFPTQEPDYLKGLLGDKYADLQRQSTTSGLINAALTYLTLPKNQNLGTANILARSYLGGLQGAQGIYDTRAKQISEGINVARALKQTELEGMTEIDRLLMNRNKLAELDPNNPNIALYDRALAEKTGAGMTEFDKQIANLEAMKKKDPNNPMIGVYEQFLAQKGGLYGSSVEGVSYNTLLRGSGNSEAAKAVRASPQYAIAYREAFAPKVVMQTVQDPVTGVTKQIPVEVRQAPPPKNILPPIYEYDGKATPAETTTTAATTTPADTGGNVTSAPTALTPTLFKEYDTKVNEANLFNTSLETLKNDIKQNGLQIGGLGTAGFRQQTLYEDALTKLRIADQLGVLNKEDLPRLQKKLPPPDQISTWVKGGGSIDALIGAIEAVQQSNNAGIKYYTGKMYPTSKKPESAGGGLTLDLDAISRELKRRKGGK